VTEAALPSVIDDPRWHAFHDKGFACSCGQTHVGLFPIQMQVPKGWPGDPTYEPNEALRMNGDFLSFDYCVMDGKYFAMRMRFPLAMRGAEVYVNAERRSQLAPNARAPARLINNINGYENTGGLMGSAFHQEDGGYPVLLVHGPQPDNDANHPLINHQRNGIGVDTMLDLFAAYGHDMRTGAGK
jgi:hypothetical protein